jgi:hypothetical protein
MDGSDRIRKLQGQTQWVYYSTITLANQPTCNTGCGATLASTCTTKYVTFAQRYSIAEGRTTALACNNGNACV